MINRLLTVGLLAGLVVGLAVAALQHVTTTPLILQAEVFEKAGDTKAAAIAMDGHRVAALGEAGVVLAQAHDGHPAGHDHDAAGEWSPADGLERTAVTVLSTVAMSIGYALLLLAVMTLSGETITVESGVVWGAAAFAATGLATAAGLAPELPGSAAAQLADRQVWWIATALASSVGIWLIVRRGGTLGLGVGLALLAAPHVIGAPHTHGFGSSAPAELAAQFAARSLALSAVMWLLIGAAVGLFWRQTAPKPALA